jgi:phosphatidylserine/phosphatidylglycerophosphate/cardiolipin synthase-like enzyme
VPELVYQSLQKHGVQVQWGAPGFSFTHAKFLLADGARAWIGTMNWTPTSFEENRDFAVVTRDHAVVAQSTTVFDADWERRAVTGNLANLVVSPINARAKISSIIRDAKVSLDIYAESISDKLLINLLIGAAGRHVAVRIIWGQLGDLGDLLGSGVHVVIGKEPFAHAKAIVADGSTVFIGSENFTATSLDRNRELGLIVTDRSVINGVEQAFRTDFRTGVPLVASVAAAPPPRMKWSDGTTRAGETPAFPVELPNFMLDVHGRWTTIADENSLRGQVYLCSRLFSPELQYRTDWSPPMVRDDALPGLMEPK